MSARDWTEFDAEMDGKHFSWIKIGHSVNKSGYGVIPIPITIIKNGAGPTLLLQAGVHGDEYEGQIALARLIHDLDPGSIKGRIIVIPAANRPAVVAGTRVSPIDDENLNRVFPGDPYGSVTERIAHFIAGEILPLCDSMIDLHSGGQSSELMIYCAAGMTGQSQQDEKTRALLKAFNAPVSLEFKSEAGGGNVSQVARDLGVTVLTAELGGGGGVDIDALNIGERGVYRVLDHLGMLPLGVDWQPAIESRGVRISGTSAYTYVYEAGVFEPLHRLGDPVNAGEVAGYIHFPENPGREAIPVHFDAAGLLYCRRAIGRVEPGDCVAHLAIPLD